MRTVFAIVLIASLCLNGFLATRNEIERSRNELSVMEVESLNHVCYENEHLRRALWEIWRQTSFEGMSLTEKEMTNPEIFDDFQEFQDNLTEYTERREQHRAN